MGEGELIEKGTSSKEGRGAEKSRYLLPFFFLENWANGFQRVTVSRDCSATHNLPTSHGLSASLFKPFGWFC